MELIKCNECNNHFEKDDIEFVYGSPYCYNCIKQCKNCNSYHVMYRDYCYYCLEGGLVIDY